MARESWRPLFLLTLLITLPLSLEQLQLDAVEIDKFLEDLPDNETAAINATSNEQDREPETPPIPDIIDGELAPTNSVEPVDNFDEKEKEGGGEGGDMVDIPVDEVVTTSTVPGSNTTTREETTTLATSTTTTSPPPPSKPPSQSPATTSQSQPPPPPPSVPPPSPPKEVIKELTTSSIAEKVLNNLTTTPSHPLTTSLSEETEEPSGVDPTYPPGEIEPLISISIFLIFILLALSSVLVYLMIRCRFRYLPESIAFVIIGFIVGLVYHLLMINNVAILSYQEKFSPQSFFLLLLPPIIFESGYSLHKGNFFQNLGSIIVFAVIGTAISTFIVGGGLYGLSVMGLVYNLNAIQSFTFGALISAVDPVATLAIFHALDVNPTLNMLVFGESVLNDAVSIVMTKTILKQATSTASPGMVLLVSLGDFLLMFCVSAIIGIIFALVSAMFLKFVNFRENYSLEFAMWFLFAFGPYFLAEGLQLSGIMAVLFCGIVMSHYTHYNLTPVTQVTVQQTMRTVSFLAETVVFLYIGMQVFTITTSFSFSLIIWSLILILIGRAANIFPLSFLVNRFRTVNISPRMQFIMWFSGLRGAIAYALALNLSERHHFGSQELLSTIATTTLVIVLFTIVVFGGSTLPILKILSKGSAGSDLKLSKTEDQGAAVTPGVEEDTDSGPQLTRGRLQWFLMLDYRYFKPFLVRKFTKQEVHEARIEMQRRTNEWYQGVRAVSSEEEEEETGLSHTILKLDNNLIRERRATSGSSSNASFDGRTASPTLLV